MTRFFGHVVTSGFRTSLPQGIRSQSFGARLQPESDFGLTRGASRSLSGLVLRIVVYSTIDGVAFYITREYPVSYFRS